MPFFRPALALVVASLLGACVGDDPVSVADAGPPTDAAADSGAAADVGATDAGACPAVASENFNVAGVWTPNASGSQLPCVIDPQGDRVRCEIRKEFSVLQRPFFAKGPAGTNRATFTVLVSALADGKDVIVAQLREQGRARLEIHALATGAGVQFSASTISNSNAVVLAAGVAFNTPTTIDVTWSGPLTSRSATFATASGPKTIATGDSAADAPEPLFQFGPYDWRKDVDASSTTAAVSYGLPMFAHCD
jgi:hypothetical protein